MKTALVTTTISVPTVLQLYRKLGPDVRFYIAGDIKTPAPVQDFAAALGECFYLIPENQKAREWKCSELIGWNTIRRRNIAVLEALAWGADIIITIDDDNIPLTSDYFFHMTEWLGSGCYGHQVTTPTHWFDPGSLAIPKTKHRGFPHDKASSDLMVESVVDCRLGVVAGLVLGDPDIDACTRLEHRPILHSVSELARVGVITDPRQTWTVFNTQNTAYLRELAPCMFCPPGVGRHDDIFASLITQRVMRELNLHVHIGQPFVWQQRNPHDLMKDMNEEVFGMTHIVELAQWLNEYQTEAADDVVFTVVASIYDALEKELSWWPKIATEAALAWCDDMESVL